MEEFIVEPTEGDYSGREKLRTLCEDLRNIAGFQGGGTLEDQDSYNFHWRLPLACYQRYHNFSC